MRENTISQPRLITNQSDRIKPVRFEAVGLVANVLHQAEIGVPTLFPNKGVELSHYIKETVAGYTTTHGFPYISLSICDGLAELELEHLATSSQKTTAPILIDPTAYTPEPRTYPDAKALAQQKSTILHINIEHDDVLLTLYGLNSFDGRTQLEHILRRLQYMDALLQMLATTDMLGTSQMLGAERARAAATLHQIKAISGQIAVLKQTVSKSIETNKPLEPKAIEQQISTLTKSLVQLQSKSTTPLVRQVLQTMIEQVKDLPRQFPVLATGMKAQQTLNLSRSSEPSSSKTTNVIPNNTPKAGQHIQPIKQAAIGDKVQITPLKTNAPQPFQQTRNAPPVVLQQKTTSVPVTIQKTALRTTQTHTVINNTPSSQTTARVAPVTPTSISSVPTTKTETIANQTRSTNTVNANTETPAAKRGSISTTNVHSAKSDASPSQINTSVSATAPTTIVQTQAVQVEIKNQGVVQTSIAQKVEPPSVLNDSPQSDAIQKPVISQTTQTIITDSQAAQRVSEVTTLSKPPQEQVRATVETRTSQPIVSPINEPIKQGTPTETQKQTITPPVTPILRKDETIQPQRLADTLSRTAPQQTVQAEAKPEPPAHEHRQTPSTSVPHVQQRENVVKPEAPPVITQYRETVRELVERTSQATDAFIANSSKTISGFVGQASQGLSSFVSSIMPSPAFAGVGTLAFSQPQPDSNVRGNEQNTIAKKSTRPQLNLKGCCGQGAACVCC